jgi:hypothetical protein
MLVGFVARWVLVRRPLLAGAALLVLAGLCAVPLSIYELQGSGGIGVQDASVALFASVVVASTGLAVAFNRSRRSSTSGHK